MKLFKTVLFLLATIYALSAQEIKEEEIQLKNIDIELNGTLSYPEINGDLPLIIFVPGSGNVDRNGNQAGVNVKANYIKQLADTLNTNGIAFFRYDKRTANPKNLEKLLKDMRFEYLVDDVKVIINYFKKDDRFKKIIVLGHSQGSLVGMLAIDEKIEGYISLAGLSETMEGAIIRQISNQNKELGQTAAAHFKELKETDTIREVNPFLASIFNPLNHQFIKSYNSFNPIEEIKKVPVTTLIINGDSDLQVRIEDAQALQKAKPTAQLVIIPKMNHVLKKVTNAQENQASYFAETFPISDELINTLVTFIKK